MTTDNSQLMFTGHQKEKLNSIINEGMKVMAEIDALRGGLNDAIKAIAEELEVKPSTLKKAITVAHKAKFKETSAEFEALETILQTVGRDDL